MKRIALLGMPNTGKSTLFNRISGASARVGNWPGITVDLMSAKVLLGGHIAELVDLPGIYDLHGFSEDEQVVRHFLANNPLDLAIVLLNSSQIDRQLSLLLQIKKLNIPMVLALNMSDEAKKSGINIDTDQLAKSLNMPVLQISAKYGEGLPKALQAAAAVINQAQATSDPARISLALEEDQKIEKEMESLLARNPSF
jgi:ferrous iron transport protein B